MPRNPKRLRDIRPEGAIAAPTEGSRAAIEVEIEAVDSADNRETCAVIDGRIADNFEGIDWKRLQEYFYYNNSWSRDKVVHEITLSTSSALKYIALSRPSYRRDNKGKLTIVGERAVGGLVLTQEFTNLVVVSWLVDNNYLLREFETPTFKEMIAYVNLEAAEAFKIIKGGKRSFFRVVAYFADANSNLRNLPIALPQLIGAYIGEKIAKVISKILRSFGITNFNALDRRLRCAPYTLNLRKGGPLGVLIDIINYIKTPM
ncbi:hypothetical protein GQ44DRAFT_744172 [Phaeosphaeriaceae sp. PMI808]|nr:hypothetical protein GQ44DRAFT_744172 [Phaeosphaeriaceae sp. PMI808]